MTKQPTPPRSFSPENGKSDASARAPLADRSKSADILPFGQPRDYPERQRFVRPVNLYDSIDPRVRQLEFERDKPALSEGIWLAIGASVALWIVVFFLIGKLS